LVREEGAVLTAPCFCAFSVFPDVADWLVRGESCPCSTNQQRRGACAALAFSARGRFSVPRLGALLAALRLMGSVVGEDNRSMFTTELAGLTPPPLPPYLASHRATCPSCAGCWSVEAGLCPSG